MNLSSETSYLELLRPGYTRISLPYFISDNELAFVMEAVKMVATEGWKLLPQYVVDLDTGEWRHHTNAVTKDRKWLGSIRYIDGKMTMNERRISGPGSFPQSYSECLQTARNLFNRARKTALRHPYADQSVRFDNRCDKLRWFMTQQEAQDMLTKNSQSVKQVVPFDPLKSIISKKHEHKEDRGSAKAPQSNNSSPRHYSLPAIDDPRVIGCSSPLPYLLQDYNGLYYTTPFTQSPVNFAVGETVRSATMLNPTLPTASPLTFRERCFSLGAPNVSPPVLSPQTRVSLGINQQSRQRNCSCSSQTDLHSLDSDLNMSPTHSLNILSTSSFDCSQMGRASPLPDLQSYVTEMTKELATNIKSEIRGVISKVEDALESNDANDISSSNVHVFDKQGSGGSDDGRSDSISANDIAEYLEKVSKEMANEVKSEIRDVVSAVDVYFTPDRRSYSRASSTGESEKCSKYEHYTPGSSSETVIQMINKSNSTTRLSDEENSSDKSYKNKLLTSTVTSLSSQDSGINLSFHEQESHDYANRRSSTESTSKQIGDKLKSTLEIHSESSDNSEHDKSNSSEDVIVKWISPPKNIWQSCVEAIQEYEMIRNGDKVMVCLSGGKDSLSLLHTLLQYQSFVQSKGIVFTIGAITINPDIAGCDPLILLPHLKSIGVDYIIEDHNEIAPRGTHLRQLIHTIFFN